MHARTANMEVNWTRDLHSLCS